MKNIILKTLSGIGFLILVVMVFTVNSVKNNQINDTTLENIIALNKADAESNGVYCWGTSSTCLTDWNGDRIVGKRQNF